MSLSKLIILVTLVSAPPAPVRDVRDNARMAADKVRQGDALFRQDDLRGACKAYQEALAILPSWWMPRLAVVRCGRFVGVPIKQLVEHAEFAVKARPQIPVTHLHYGLVLEESGQIDRAIGAYESALRQHVDLATARYRLGVLLARKGRLNAAKRHLEAVLKSRSNYMVARTHLSRVYEDLGQLDFAERQYKSLVHRSRYPARALSALIRFYERHGQKKRARDARRLYRARYGQ